MALNPTVMQAVEQLDYRVTIGDVATKSGLNVNLAEQDLLALAAEAGGHLQVAESGDVVYAFPKDFRAILRNKHLRLQLQEWWNKVWRVLFYLIRISFGIVLLLSIALIFIAIFIILASLNRDGDSDQGGSSRSDGGGVFMPHVWLGPDLFWFFDPGYDRRYRQRERSASSQGKQMNFLEAIFSFLFGDGNPNADLEERRWQTIGTVIRNNGGAVVAEQIAPYLDSVGQGYAREYEEYMLPVLTRFNGRPEVSPDGQLVYHFPELQTTAAQRHSQPAPAYLREWTWRFSSAGSGQIIGAIALGSLNFVGALVLGSLLADGAAAAQLGGLVAFVQSIYWLLLGYGTAFLVMPLIRYFWIQWRNRRIEARNQKRQDRAVMLNQANADLQKKLAYAHQFAAETVVRQEDLVYTTETDLLEQEAERSEQIDAEWQQRLNQSGSQ